MINKWINLLEEQRAFVETLGEQTKLKFEEFKSQKAPKVDEVKGVYNELVHSLRKERKFLTALEKKIKRLSLQ